MKSRRGARDAAGLSAVGLVALYSLGLDGGRAAATSAQVQDPPPLPPLDYEVEITRVAEELGVKREIVAQHFALRDSIADLRGRLESHPNFAGLWVEQDGALRVLVAFAGVDAGEALAPYAATFPDPRVLSARSALWTLAELEQAATEIAQIREVRRQKSQPLFDLGIDEPSNQVVIDATSESIGESVRSDIQAAARHDVTVADASPLVRIAVVPELAEPECSRSACYPGGVAGIDAKWLDVSTVKHCTTGFTATREGVVGVLTAAHCVNGLDHDGVSLGPVEAEQYAGPVDVQWHALPSGWDDWSAIFVGLPDEGFRAVRSVGGVSSDYVGMPVCSSGYISGYTCGTITSINYAPNYQNAGPFTPDFRLATYTSASGDSGAPVFYGEEALGIHSGKRTSDGSGYAIYSHVGNAVTALSVNVSTK